MKRTNIFVLLLMLVLSIVFLSGCKTANNVNPNDNSIGYINSDVDTFVVETDYCPLHFPVKWEEYIEVEIFTETAYSVLYSAILDNGDRVPVFEIVFNESNDGVLLGTLDNSEKVNVYLVDHSDNLPSDLTEDDTERIYMISEDVNVLISKLIYESNMIAE